MHQAWFHFNCFSPPINCILSVYELVHINYTLRIRLLGGEKQLKWNQDWCIAYDLPFPFMIKWTYFQFDAFYKSIFINSTIIVQPFSNIPSTFSQFSLFNQYSFKIHTRCFYNHISILLLSRNIYKIVYIYIYYMCACMHLFVNNGLPGFIHLQLSWTRNLPELLIFTKAFSNLHLPIRYKVQID